MRWEWEAALRPRDGGVGAAAEEGGEGVLALHEVREPWVAE